MEIQEEEVQFQQRFSSERSRRLEMQKKEAILVQESEVHSWYGRLIAEKESRVETKKEASQFEVPIRHL